MLTPFGDDERDVIELQNNYTIIMDFSREDKESWGWRGRISGKWRRVRLYDEKDILISEIIELNPLYKPQDIKMKIHTPPGILE